MAVTLTLAELRNAVRTEESTEEDQILTRLLAVGTSLVERAAPDAPEAIQNEATVRVSAYLYDQPPAARNGGTSNRGPQQRRRWAAATLPGASGREYRAIVGRHYIYDHAEHSGHRSRHGGGQPVDRGWRRGLGRDRQHRPDPA